MADILQKKMLRRSPAARPFASPGSRIRLSPPSEASRPSATRSIPAYRTINPRQHAIISGGRCKSSMWHHSHRLRENFLRRKSITRLRVARLQKSHARMAINLQAQMLDSGLELQGTRPQDRSRSPSDPCRTIQRSVLHPRTLPLDPQLEAHWQAPACHQEGTRTASRRLLRSRKRTLRVVSHSPRDGNTLSLGQ